MNDGISVIVLTKNSQKHLDKCLKSIINQKYDRFEVIVVDAGSMDSTHIILLDYKLLSNVDFDIVYVNSNTTIGKARQIGLEKSKYDVLAYIDSDVELPHNDWFKDMLIPLNENMIAGVQTLSKNRDDDSWILKRLHSGFEYKNKIIGIENYEIVGTGHLLIKKDVINEVGGFKDIQSAEDIDLTKRIMQIGYYFVYLPNEKVYHYHIDGLISYIKKHLIRNKLYALRRIFFEGTKI